MKTHARKLVEFLTGPHCKKFRARRVSSHGAPCFQLLLHLKTTENVAWLRRSVIRRYGAPGKKVYMGRELIKTPWGSIRIVQQGRGTKLADVTFHVKTKHWPHFTKAWEKRQEEILQQELRGTRTSSLAGKNFVRWR